MKIVYLYTLQIPQELRNYFLEHHLKHIVLKGEKNEENLNNSEINDLIRAACNFLVAQHGPNPKQADRTLLADSIHVQFPRLDSKLIFKKLSARTINIRRPRKVNKARNRIKAETKTIESNGKTDGKDSSSDDEDPDEADYDELVTSYNIVTNGGEI